MRATLLIPLCLFATTATAAQDTAIVIHPESAGIRLEARELPRIIAEEVVRFYNASGTARLVGDVRIPREHRWGGDVAVRRGPVVVAGRVEGSLYVVNGDLRLEDGARVTGSVVVVGGTVSRGDGALVDGEVREYREPLPYRVEGDALVYAPDLRRRLPLLGAQRTWGMESRSTLTLATAGTFNRVEGLPVAFGPLFDLKLGDAVRFRVDALGLFRTAGDLSDSRSDLGYMLRTELRAGEYRPGGLGLRVYDLAAPVEDWTLRPYEVGWSAFLFHRDYRDYYLSKGAAGRVFFQVERQLALSLELRREWQTSVSARDPWTVFRSAEDWRPNPPIDAGHYTTLVGALTIDTRNDEATPTSGWYLRAHLERGASRDVTPHPALPPAVRAPVPTDGSYAYRRAFVDLRRYNRVSPGGRLNLRFVLGGWLGGDPLPLQRRLSLGGPDPAPGYAFRHSACNRDITDPTFAGSLAAACDRVLLAQGEYRGHIRINWSYAARGTDAGAPGHLPEEPRFHLEGMDLVVFVDAGQAWLVGRGPGRVPADRLPTIGSWLADLGLGVDAAGLGVYVAKAMTVGEPLRFSVRLDHRF